MNLSKQVWLDQNQLWVKRVSKSWTVGRERWKSRQGEHYTHVLFFNNHILIGIISVQRLTTYLGF